MSCHNGTWYTIYFVDNLMQYIALQEMDTLWRLLDMYICMHFASQTTSVIVPKCPFLQVFLRQFKGITNKYVCTYALGLHLTIYVSDISKGHTYSTIQGRS